MYQYITNLAYHTPQAPRLKATSWNPGRDIIQWLCSEKGEWGEGDELGRGLLTPLMSGGKVEKDAPNRNIEKSSA